MKYISTILLILLFSGNVQSQIYAETNKLVASNRLMNGRFGSSVAISENYAVIGTFPFTSHTGVVYIYEKQIDNTWIEFQTLTSDEYSFGKAVAIYNDTIVITADSANNGGGSAYIFEKNSDGQWVFVQEIEGSDLINNDNFGVSVAVFQNTIAIGSSLSNFDVNGQNQLNDAGAAYIFEKELDGIWIETKKITSSNRTMMEYFGKAVAVSDEFIVVGSSRSAKVYAFSKINNIWTEVQLVQGSDSSLFDSFGASIAMDNNYLAVGANEKDYDPLGPGVYSEAGAVYIFELDSQGLWGEVQKVNASDASEDDLFGYSVSISDNKLLIGAYFEDDDILGNNSLDRAGSAYLFNRNSMGQWQETQKIVASDRESIDYFGQAVSISGDNLVIGALRESHDEDGDNYLLRSGSAYISQSETSLSLNHSSISKINLYPNPTNNFVKINFANEQKLVTVTLINQLGQKLSIDAYKDTDFIKYKVNQNVGIYFIIIENDYGKKKYFKIIKK